MNSTRVYACMGILSLNDNGFEAFVRDGPSDNREEWGYFDFKNGKGLATSLYFYVSHDLCNMQHFWHYRDSLWSYFLFTSNFVKIVKQAKQKLQTQPSMTAKGWLKQRKPNAVKSLNAENVFVSCNSTVNTKNIISNGPLLIPELQSFPLDSVDKKFTN